MRHTPGKGPVVTFDAVVAPNNVCCMMPKAFLEEHQYLDKMQAKSASHMDDTKPHTRLGILEYRIRRAGDRGNSKIVTFCVVDGEDTDGRVVLGSSGLALFHPLDGPAAVRNGAPVRPILPGRDKGGLRSFSP